MNQQKLYLQHVIKACESSQIILTDDMLSKLYRYYELLVEWNEKINLTAITQIDEVYLKHFADSIYGSKYFKQNAVVCDLGTGAGFPGLVLKIVRPDLNVVLVDALDKRIKFLKTVIDELQLTSIEALHFRAEDKLFKQNYLNTFDYVVARAVAKMNTLTEYCLPFVKVGGQMIAYKSDKINDELFESVNAIKIIGGNNYKIQTYNLDTETERWIVVVDKIRETNAKYPRDKNKPKLSPLV